MFDLLEKPLVWISVKFPGLAQEAEGEGTATLVEHRIELCVEIVPRDEFRALFLNNLEAKGEPAAEIDVFKRVVSGWRKIVADRKPVPFTDDNIVRLLNVPGFATAFGTAYLQAWQGQVETREGNSDSLPAGGQADAQAGATAAAEKV